MLISSTNVATWPSESSIMHSACGSAVVPPPFDLEPEDIVWIGTRNVKLQVNFEVHYATVDDSCIS